MAEGFRVTGQRSTPWPDAQGRAQPAVELTVEALPSGIPFVRVVPLATWKQGGVAKDLGAIASSIAAITGKYPIASAAPYQTLDSQGHIVNAVEFVVTAAGEKGTANPAHSTTVTVPVQALHDQTDFAGTFGPAIDLLNQTKNL